MERLYATTQRKGIGERAFAHDSSVNILLRSLFVGEFACNLERTVYTSLQAYRSDKAPASSAPPLHLVGNLILCEPTPFLLPKK